VTFKEFPDGDVLKGIVEDDLKERGWIPFA
jgi:hypothetical protein